MSFKLQAIAAIATTGIVASVATPLTLQSRITLHDLPFSEKSIQRMVKDADSRNTVYDDGTRLEDIFTENRIGEFVQLVNKIRKLEDKGKFQEDLGNISLSAEERKLISSFYAVYSLLDKRTSVNEKIEEKNLIKVELFKNKDTVKILEALEDLNWEEDTFTLNEKFKKELDNWDISPLKHFYIEKPQNIGNKSDVEVSKDIAIWLLKDMEAIHRGHFLVK